MIAIELRTIARALGGNVAGRNSVVAPGPGHSPHDRSLSVKLDAERAGRVPGALARWRRLGGLPRLRAPAARPAGVATR